MPAAAPVRSVAAAAAAARLFSSSRSGPIAPLSSSRTAVIFPGQGSQRCGSSVRELESEWPSIVRPVWQELDETLQLRLSRTLKDGLASELQSTELAQPAILAHSFALWQVLRTELGLKDLSSLCAVTMGHSLGEFTALTAAGSLSLADAVRLVHARGTAMKHATRPGEGGMVALLCDAHATALHVPSITALLQEAAEATKKPIQIANINSPFQLVVSGHVDAIEHVKQRVNKRASAKGADGNGSDSLTRGILKAVSLDVSGPFHSAMMSPASDSLRASLSAARFAVPVVPVLFNVHAHPSTRVERFPEYLQSQLLEPVLWQPSVAHALLKLNVSNFVELGPSTPLSALLRSTAARLAKQTGVLDPFVHPADAGLSGGRATQPPHPSILPLLVPRPKVLLDDGSATESRDSEAALAGVTHAWGQVHAVGISGPTEMRAFLKQQSTPSPTEA